MTQEQEETITDTDIIQELAISNFDKQNKENTLELSLVDKIILLKFLKEREKQILGNIHYYSDIIKKEEFNAFTNNFLDKTISRLRERFNFHNYFGWKYIMNINELRIVNLEKDIRIELNQVKF